MSARSAAKAEPWCGVPGLPLVFLGGHAVDEIELALWSKHTTPCTSSVAKRFIDERFGEIRSPLTVLLVRSMLARSKAKKGAVAQLSLRADGDRAGGGRSRHALDPGQRTRYSPSALRAVLAVLTVPCCIVQLVRLCLRLPRSTQRRVPFGEAAMSGFRLKTTPGSAVPIYRQIVEQIRAAIARGELAPRDALPSVRVVAEELVVNANTIAKAYGELIREGDLVSEPGRGVFVAERKPQLTAAERRRRLRTVAERAVAETVNIGASRAELDAAIDAYCEHTGLLIEEEDDGGVRSA